MKQFNKIMLLFLFGLVALAQIAQAQVPGDSFLTTRFSTGIAISPYAQAVPNDSYTFIGVSHPSLDTALTQIGLVVEVIGMQTTVNTAAGRATIFTINAGETHRIFVANQSHADIKPTADAFSDARTHIIPTVDSAQFGSVRVTAVSERSRSLAIRANASHVPVGTTKKYDGVGQVSIWGIVYTQSSGTGFAMEFVGDMHDSSLGGEIEVSVPSRMNGCSPKLRAAACQLAVGTGDQARPGRGIN
ncbi:MAG: hypothetical protein VX579_03435 [Nitrospinota bacterium]|nr:hypothetical protein [Nitrospinota bacterium]